jgi:hypothetical protein
MPQRPQPVDDAPAPAKSGRAALIAPTPVANPRKGHSYKIDPSVGKQIRKLAHARDVPIADVVEQALRDYLRAHTGEVTP